MLGGNGVTLVAAGSDTITVQVGLARKLNGFSVGSDTIAAAGIGAGQITIAGTKTSMYPATQRTPWNTIRNQTGTEWYYFPKPVDLGKGTTQFQIPVTDLAGAGGDVFVNVDFD